MKISCILSVLAWLSVAFPTFGQDAKPASSSLPIVLSYPFTDGIAIFSIPEGSVIAAAHFYAYGGEPLSLPLTVQAPLGTHLRIQADVWQQTSVVVAPWQRGVPVSEEIVFDDRTSQIVECKLPELRAVQRKTRVSVVLRTDPKLSRYPGGLSIQGFVYPREEPGEWQKHFAALLSRSGIRRVVFFGSWKNPANFLRERKIAFNDLGDGWPADPDPHTLYLGSGVPRTKADASPSVPRAFAETPGTRLVLFEPWDTETLPPGVYQTAGVAGGGVWKVTLPDLFVGAGLNDPHELEILTTLFEQVLPLRQNASGTDLKPSPTP